MELLLPIAFIAGALTVLAPCTWAVLPLVLGASASGGGRRPVGVILGLMSTFILATVILASALAALGVTTSGLRTVAVVALAFVAIGLLVPWINDGIGRALGGVVQAGSRLGAAGRDRDGLVGGLILGGALGLVWAPCVGPIMAGVIAIAVSRGPSLEIGAVAIVYALGAGIPLLVVASRGRRVLSGLGTATMRRGRQVSGGAMLVSCLAIATGLDITFQNAVAGALPAGWTSALYAIERNPQTEVGVRSLDDTSAVAVGDYGPAPEFDGITEWINSEPLSVASLRGKVVLVHFWTFGCINCRNVQPYVKAWYDRYHDAGLEVVGVHTPELSYERDIENVKAAVADADVRFPVAFDPGFKTWRRYSNSYWPAFYYVDRAGEIRFVHAGEGAYEEQEDVIRRLLAEPPPA